MMCPYPYLHNVGVNDYMMKVLLVMNEGVYAFNINVWRECYDDYNLNMCLLSIFEVMGLQMYVALDLDWDCE